ncbi:MAG: hypothetical protein ACKOD5_14355 [Chthoniobacterales bacterium]
MKRFDILAIFVVVAMVFVALLLHILAPKSTAATGALAKVPESAAPTRPLSLCTTFLKATIAGDFAAFKNACLKEGDGQMKLFSAQPGTKEMFRRAAETIAPACGKGYELEYLTSMNQQGSEVFLWKLVPRLGQSQFLVRLTLKDGKVSGFFFQ